MKAHGRLLLVLAILIAAFVASSLSQPLPADGKRPSREDCSGDDDSEDSSSGDDVSGEDFFGDDSSGDESFGADGLGAYMPLSDGSGSSHNTEEHIGHPWTAKIRSTYHFVAEHSPPHNSTGSSSSSKGKGIARHLFDKLKPHTVSKPCAFSEKEEKQRRKFNRIMENIFHTFNTIYRNESDSARPWLYERYRTLWKTRAELIKRASRKLRKEMRKLAEKRKEWQEWKAGVVPEEIDEIFFKFEPRDVSIPDPCEKTESSSQSHQ